MTLDWPNIAKSELAPRLQHLASVESIFEALKNDESAQFDLLFYGSFVKKMMTVMQREGKDTLGFDRMQISVREGIEKIRSLVMLAGQRGFADTDQFTELSPSGMNGLMSLIGDLAILKDAHLNEESRNRPAKTS